MGIYTFFSWSLVTILAVTLLWPWNIPLVALAYKIRHGYQAIPFEPRAFWLRSTFAALGLGGLSLVLLGLAYGLIDGVELPAGPVQLVLFMAYVPAGVWFLFWIFALEDMLQSLGVFVVYILLPGLPILLLGRIIGVWQNLAPEAPWLFLST